MAGKGKNESLPIAKLRKSPYKLAEMKGGILPKKYTLYTLLRLLSYLGAVRLVKDNGRVKNAKINRKPEKGHVVRCSADRELYSHTEKKIADLPTYLHIILRGRDIKI
jgi:hypothetical protein